MGIFDFLKKEKEKEIISEKLTFSEIEDWIERKRKENEIEERELVISIKDRIKNLDNELKIKLSLLDEIDIESRKEDGRIKRVVSNSRIQYIGAVNNLMANLENLKETSFPDFVKKIDRALSEFNKTSFKNYERTTILIGKEMADIKEEVKSFSKDLVEIFNSNKEISELSQRIGLIKSKLNLLDSTEKNKIGIKKTIISLDEKIKQDEKENQRCLTEIEKIKQSENYKNMLEKKEKLNILKEEFREKILTLKQLIDFKALTNFFHTNEKQMNILKEYKTDFYTNFEQDNGKRILDLLEESKLNTNIISERENLIKSKKEILENYEKEIEKDETHNLNYKIEKITIEIENLKIEKVKERKRKEKLNINKEELTSSLKQELGKINIEIK